MAGTQQSYYFHEVRLRQFLSSGLSPYLSLLLLLGFHETCDWEQSDEVYQLLDIGL